MDGYLWLGRTGNNSSSGVAGGSETTEKTQLMTLGGPSVKFHITNIHTMDEVSDMLLLCVCGDCILYHHVKEEAVMGHGYTD
eukprot:scaffold227819_cov23-Cyclotella_meneghiniana.AAC.1